MAGQQRATVKEFTAYEVNLVGRFIRSSVGRKVLMALTGAALFAFAFVHMAGNLQIFLGREAVNHYAHFLKSNNEIIWPTRLGLLVCVIVHILTGISLKLENRRARDQQYAVQKPLSASLASRTMLWTGSIFLVYVVYHLLHLTLGKVQPEYLLLRDKEGQHDVYGMMITAFSNPWIVAFYIIGTGAVCFHLSHGASAMFQSLGLKNPAYAEHITNLAKLMAFLLFLGYATVPLAVLFGVVK
jgi:succinate dehydrogenase / fumarate reductase cytochrome b subunit